MRSASHQGAWSLTIFTVLAQAAVGTCLARACICWAASSRTPAEELVALTRPALLLALGLLVAGGISATRHLGRAAGARYALTGLLHSWLSREMALSLAFGTGVATELGLGLLDAGSPALRGAVSAWNVVLGLVLVHAISSIYRIRTVPAWDNWMTPAAFLGTTGLLGTALFATVLIGSTVGGGAHGEVVRDGIHWIVAAFALLTGPQLLVAGLHLRRYLGGDESAADYRARDAGQTQRMLGWRILGTSASLLLLVGIPWQSGTATSSTWTALFLAVLACLLILAAELLGRSLFYASHRRVGL